jgi:hypothetical protein
MAHARSTGSLPVANVQALAETCNDPDQQIPERYIRADANADEVISGDDCTAAIPTVDLSKLLDPLSSDEETEKLGSACQQWGFFQVCRFLGRQTEFDQTSFETYVRSER